MKLKESIPALPKKRAGIIPFYVDENGKIEMMLMVPSDPKFGGEKFQIAKGEIDQGESVKGAAYREGKEELGLKPSNISASYTSGSYFGGKFTVFAVLIKNKSDFSPFGSETGAVKWMNWREVYAGARKEQMKMIVDAYRLIKTKI